MERLAALARQLQPRDAVVAAATFAGFPICSRQAAAGSSSVDPARFVEDGKKIVGVGKNYRAHIAELSKGKNALWKDDAASHAEPVLFIKPTTSYVRQGDPIVIPPGIGEVHHVNPLFQPLLLQYVRAGTSESL